MPPHFCPASAPVTWDKDVLRWPGPFGSGFLSPQPPGIVGIGPIAVNLTGPTQVGPFLFWASAGAHESSSTSPSCSIILFKHDLFGNPLRTFPDHALGSHVDRRRVPAMMSPNLGLPGSPGGCRVRLHSRGGRGQIQTPAGTGRQRISAATCRPRPASVRACHGCRPGRRPPRRRCHRGQYRPKARSSFRMCHSSRRPSAGCARHCNM